MYIHAAFCRLWIEAPPFVGENENVGIYEANLDMAVDDEDPQRPPGACQLQGVERDGTPEHRAPGDHDQEETAFIQRRLLLRLLDILPLHPRSLP